MITGLVVGLACGAFGGKRGWPLCLTVGVYVPVYGALKLATYVLTGPPEWS